MNGCHRRNPKLPGHRGVNYIGAVPVRVHNTRSQLVAYLLNLLSLPQAGPMRKLQGDYSKALPPKLGHERMTILASIEDREYVLVGGGT